MDPAIPERQYELAAKPELEVYRTGGTCAPFDALVNAMRHIPAHPHMSLLDVGASGGYYSEVLKIGGFDFQYHGIDFSSAFKELAARLYPGIWFDVGDARSLPYHDDFFEVVLNGAVIMHTLEYPKVIQETARVSSKYVIFHRTPIRTYTAATNFYLKEGYGVPMFEVHFNESELLGLFNQSGLELLHTENVFFDGTFGHRTYLLKKQQGLNHIQV